MASRVSGRVAAVTAAAAVAALAGAFALVAAGGNGSASPAARPDPSTAPSTSTSQPQTHTVAAVKPRPLRAGESRMTLRMPRAYQPSAPHGVGTDDYRCFLLDPHLAQSRYLTGTFVEPDNRNVVHHVILFRADPAQVTAAEQLDAHDPGEGWTCFGDSGLPNSNDLDNAPWLGAWAPGGRESVDSPGYGVPLPAGSRIIMQVHYNLLAGPGPDRSAALLRLAPAVGPPDAVGDDAAAGPGRAAVPPRPHRQRAVRPHHLDRRRRAPLRRGRADEQLAERAVRRSNATPR